MDDKKEQNEINGEIINDEKYNVEIAQDFSIPTISSNEITGYTAGLISRDLVKKGEEILKNQEDKKPKK